jgi:hypothetical protein
MSLARAKKIAAVILAETATPAAVMVLSHNLRGALADLAAELVEVNQRLEILEQGLTWIKAREAAKVAIDSEGDPDAKI